MKKLIIIFVVAFINSSFSFAQTNGPKLSLPLDKSNNQQSKLSLVWHKYNGYEEYSVQIAENKTFSKIMFNKANIIDTIMQIEDLKLSSKYYWRVQAIKNGKKSKWSTIWSFTTGSAPQKPILQIPADNSIDRLNSLTFSWDSSKGATSYLLQVAYDSNFTQVIYTQDDIKFNNLEINRLKLNKHFYWRVLSKNIFGDSDWSKIYCFSTIKEMDYGNGLRSNMTIKELQPYLGFQIDSFSGTHEIFPLDESELNEVKRIKEELFGGNEVLRSFYNLISDLKNKYITETTFSYTLDGSGTTKFSRRTNEGTFYVFTIPISDFRCHYFSVLIGSHIDVYETDYMTYSDFIKMDGGIPPQSINPKKLVTVKHAYDSKGSTNGIYFKEMHIYSEAKRFFIYEDKWYKFN